MLFSVFSVFSVFQKERGAGEGGRLLGKGKTEKPKDFLFFLSHSVRAGPETLLFSVFSVFSVFQKERVPGGGEAPEEEKNRKT